MQCLPKVSLAAWLSLLQNFIFLTKVETSMCRSHINFDIKKTIHIFLKHLMEYYLH